MPQNIQQKPTAISKRGGIECNSLLKYQTEIDRYMMANYSYTGTK